jgi:hypothetical protein
MAAGERAQVENCKFGMTFIDACITLENISAKSDVCVAATVANRQNTSAPHSGYTSWMYHSEVAEFTAEGTLASCLWF